MVRMLALVVAGDGETVPPAVAARGRTRGRAKAPTKGHIESARGRAPVRAQEHTKEVSVDPPTDQADD